jgi:hypothetical protein
VTPTGDVVILASLNGSAASPLSVTVPASQAAATGGAQPRIVLNIAGTYTITGSYAGDTNNAPSTAAPITLTVTVPSTGQPSFTLTADDPSAGTVSNPIYVDDEHPASSDGLTITSVAGYSGLVNLSIGSLPNSFSAVLVDAGTNQTILAATPIPAGTHIKIIFRRTNPFKVAQNDAPARVPVYFGGGLLGIIFLGWSKRRHYVGRALFLLIVISACNLILTGCAAKYGDIPVVITAAPAIGSPAAAAQSVTYNVHYQKGYQAL